MFILVEKRLNSMIDKKTEKTITWTMDNLVPLVVPIIFQEQFVFNIEINGSVQLFQKIGNIIRSTDESKW